MIESTDPVDPFRFVVAWLSAATTAPDREVQLLYLASARAKLEKIDADSKKLRHQLEVVEGELAKEAKRIVEPGRSG